MPPAENRVGAQDKRSPGSHSNCKRTIPQRRTAAERFVHPDPVRLTRPNYVEEGTSSDLGGRCEKHCNSQLRGAGICETL